MKCSKETHIRQWLSAIIILLHTVHIALGAIPSFVSPLKDGSSTRSIPESTTNGTIIYTIQATDTDDGIGASITYALDSQIPPTPDLFMLEGTDVKTAGEIDYETGPRAFILVFSATTVNGSTTANLNVTISDVNDEFPVITGPFAANIDEEQDSGTVIPTTFTATDADENDVLEYSILETGDDRFFLIDSATGDISVYEVLDFDTTYKKHFTLTVSVSDSAGHTVNQEIAIYLQNINDNVPVFFSPLADGNSVRNIPENWPNDTSVYTVQAEDADGDEITYELINQTPVDMFRLENQTLMTTRTFDYESDPTSFILTFTATSGTDTVTTDLTIMVEDLNDEVPEFSGSYSLTIEEELPIGTELPQPFTVVDDDAGDILIYRLIETRDDRFFDIDIATGRLSVTEVLDFDTASKKNFSLTVSARDSAGHTATQEILIYLENINDNVPIFSSPLPNGNSIRNIPETWPINTPVYTIEAEDADGDEITYTLVSQTPRNMFRLEGQTVLSTHAFDYETGPSEFLLTFSATSRSETKTTTLTVTVEDFNDEVPVFIGQFTLNIDEELPVGTAIPKTFDVIDADDGDILTYSLRETGDDNYFDINSTTGVITVSQVLDFDTSSQTTLTLTVSVSDNAGHTTSQQVTIYIQNINDNYPVFTSPLADGTSIKAIPETLTAGTSIYKIEAEDADGDEIIYSLMSQTPANMFRFEGKTLRTNGDFNFELGPRSFILTFRAISVNDITTTTLTVNITDENDEPPVIAGTFTIAVEEEIAVGTSVPVSYTVIDPDTNDVLKYSITDGDRYFQINADSGELQTTQRLDYETMTQHTFHPTLMVEDKAGHSSTQVITINVLNVNDNPPIFVKPLPGGTSSTTVIETVQKFTDIYTVEAEDADGTNIAYKLIDQEPADPPDMFRLVGTSLRTNYIFDFETQPSSYILTFSATTEDETVTAELTVTIEDANDNPPEFSNVESVEIDEELPVGTLLPIAFTVTDRDTGDTLRYTMSGGQPYFEINGDTGRIRTNRRMDFETMETKIFLLEITAADDADHSTTETITVTLRNINDNPLVFISPRASGSSSISISEGTAIGTPVYVIEARDNDGDSIRYQFISQDPAEPSVFKLSVDILYTDAGIDFETGPPSYRLSFNASTNTESTTVTLTIAIDDINDESPILTGSFAADLNEEVPKGTSISGIFTATDADANDVLQYSLQGQDNSFFDIDASTGILLTKTELDYETATKDKFDLIVIVTDKVDHPATATIEINLVNINDNAPIFTPAFYYATVLENTAQGVVLVTLTVADADGDDITLSISTGDDISDRKFELADNTIQTSASPIDYETLIKKGFEYKLTVIARDGTHTDSATVYITVEGQNEYDPIWATFDLEPEMAENALIGTTIVTLLAQDNDAGPHGIVTYTIDSITTNPSGRPIEAMFHIDSASGVLTTKSGSFERDNLETVGTEYYDIAVRATDQGGRFVTTSVRVTLTDINDNAPKFPQTLSHIVISEVDGQGSLIKELDAEDEDGSATITYHLDAVSSTSSHDKFFEIEELNKVKLKTNIDLDDPGNVNSFHLVVIATDGVLSGTTTIVVTVSAVNEFPPVFTDPGPVQVSENTNVDTEVLTVNAADDDGGTDGMVSYSIVAGDPESQFSIDPLTGTIKIAQALDYETQTQYSLTVKATDGGNLEDTTTVTITILDENDNQPLCDEMTIVASFPEDTEANAQIARVSCTDEDTGVLTYGIKSGDTEVFAIDASSGDITLKRDVDYDAGETFFALTIGVNSGPDSLDVSVAITITAVNEHKPVFNDPDVEIVREDVAVGYTFTSLVATDDDVSPHDIVKYVLTSVSNSGRSLFSISQSTGVVRLVDSLDYEKLPASKEYVLTVLAIDGDAQTPKTGTGTLTIRVEDVNDNVPQCAETSYARSIQEDAALNTIVIENFGCSDDDEGTNLRYTLVQSPSNDFRFDEAVDATQLVLIGALNYDVISSYTLTLAISDGVHAIEVDIDVVVTDVNNGSPAFSQTQYSAATSENAAVGQSVITIVATDPDADTSPFGKLIYSLITNPGFKFNIDSNTGKITLAGALDAEVTARYELVVQATEKQGSNSATTTCVITIEDENDNAPTCSQDVFSISLPETTAAQAEIFKLNCHDRDNTSVLQYTLASGDLAIFELDRNILRLKTQIDYEVILSDSYEVAVSVSDGTNTLQVSGVVSVTGVNEYAPVFNLDTYHVSVAEDTLVGTTMQTVSATDADRGETLVYSLVTTFETFKIEPKSGDIILMTALDREAVDYYELTVRVTDGTNIVTASVSLLVTDVNDHTPIFNPTSYSVTIPENTAANQPVITVNAVDHDDPTGPEQYGFVQFTLAETFNAFAVDPNTGQITTTVNVNYEEAKFYTLSVIATDSNYGVGAKSSTAIVTVLVTGINEHAPIWAEFSPVGTSFTLPENSDIGSSIVTMSATDDDDGIHGVVFYSISSITTSPSDRTTSGLFRLDQVSGTLTTTSHSLDRDLATGGTESYTIEVKATDQGGLSTDIVITVLITDINDNAPVFEETVYNVEISETDVAGKVVKAITARDADAALPVNYVLDTASTPASYDTYFTLDVDSLKLKTTVDLDPPISSADTFSLVVLAKDDGNPQQTGTTTVIVSVAAVNEETPTFPISPYIIDNLPESVSVGQEVQTVSAEDNDYGLDGTVIYSIIGGDPDGQFSVHPSTGKLKVEKALDYEVKDQYVLTIEAKDRGNPRRGSTTTVTINLLDESDSEPTCIDTSVSVSVSETYLVGQQVAEVSCTDADLIDTVIYSLKSGDTTVFQIDGSSGIITLRRDLDFDSGDTFFALLINVRGGDDFLDVPVSVTVTSVNEHTPAFIQPNVQRSFGETTVSGTSLADMVAQDEDAYPHGIVRYSISSVSNSGNNLFSISQDTGTVSLIGTMNYEAESLPHPKEYVIKVLAIDGGTPTAKTGTGTLTVSILDENDNVPICSQQTYIETIAETAAKDTQVIADFGCTDADAGTNLTYSLQQSPMNHFRLERTPRARLLTDDGLNFDLIQSYDLTVSVGDGKHTTDINIDIIVTDVNNGGPAFELAQYSASVQETATPGITVVTVKANDPDAASSPYGHVMYSLTGNSGNEFSIDSDTGTISVAGNLDAEETSTYILVVKAYESGGINTATVTCNVTIIDENDNSPECTRYSFIAYVSETTTPSTILETLDCMDRDVSGTVDYSISTGDLSLFQMDFSNLRLIKEVDYDVLSRDSFVVNIDVSDGSNVVQVSGTVIITPENEHTPTFTEGTYHTEIPEDIAHGSTLFKLTANDDDKGDIVEYSLTSLVSEGFSIDKSSGEIILISPLDREQQDTHELIVKGSDGLHTATATVSITVTDVNDHTPAFQSTSYSATVLENTNPGHSVITVIATDLDDPNSPSKYGEVRYSIVYTNDAFVIDVTSGLITTTKLLDYEDTQVYTIFVQAIDSNGGMEARSSTTAVTIQVGNINEAVPVFTRETFVKSVPENTPVGTMILRVSAHDSDIGDEGLITYSMTTNTHFYLNSKSGEITLKASLDYDTTDQDFAFEVEAYDSAASPMTSTCTVSISVTDINDNDPKCIPNMQATSMPEDSQSGTSIAQLTCTDIDSNDNADLNYDIYSVNGSPPDGTFIIDSQGRISLQDAMLNYEAIRWYKLLLKVTDNGDTPRSSTATVDIEISDVNEHQPVFLEDTYEHTILENTVSNLPFIRVAARDQDINDTVRYLIKSDNDYFEIDRISGDIYIVAPLDYESLGQTKAVEIMVFATDNGAVPKSSSTTVTVRVQDANDGTPVFSQGVYYGSLSETSSVEMTILRVEASDSDDDTLIYSIDGGLVIFRIEQTGDIVLHSENKLDYDNDTKTHKLIVNAEDSRGSTGTATVYISVTNENEYPPVFSDFDRSVDVNEHVDINYEVLIVSATDGDDGTDGIISYAIVSGADNKFSIDEYSGQITVSGVLDREEKTTYNLLISATDGGTPSQMSEVSLTININDVNDVSPSCDKTLYSIAIPEDAALGLTVVNLTCTDGDNDPNGINNAIGNILITNGNVGEAFELLQTGEVRLKERIDRETRDSYTLIITVADTGAPALTTTLTLAIQILDINDNDPVFDEDAYFFIVAEDAIIGYVVGSVHATDLDIGPAGEIRYQIYTGNEAGKFAIDEVSGDISLAGVLDYDTVDQSFHLEIRANNVDVAGRSGDVIVAIEIEDVNDNAPNCSKAIYAASVAENEPVSTTVIDIICMDIDSSGLPLTYAIIYGNDSQNFEIGGSSGRLFLAKELDAETNTQYEMTVDVSDGTFTTSVLIAVNVIDINEYNPTFSPIIDIIIPEDTSVGSLVYRLTASDADVSDNDFIYAIVGGDADGHFTVGSASGDIQLQTLLDRESKDTFVLTVKVVDGDSSDAKSSETDITFIIEDVNDNYPACDQTTYIVILPENAPGQLIVQPLCTDKDTDASPILKYRVMSGNDDNIFSINEDTGRIDLIGRLDYESLTSHELTCEVDDQGTLTNHISTISVILHVEPVNEFSPQFTDTDTFDATADENLPIGSYITQVKASDNDIGQGHGTVRFSFSNGNTHGLFSINSVTGVITLVKPFDYEINDAFSLTVTAKDSLGGIDELSSDFIVHINVVDVNDNTPVCAPSLISEVFDEDFQVGDSLAQLLCTDKDISAAFNSLNYEVFSINGDMSTQSQFTMSDTGILTLNSNFNFEQTNAYNILIRVSDNGPTILSTTATIQLTIINVNEFSPVFEMPSYTTNLYEGSSIGSLILRVTASDQDANDIITYHFDPDSSLFKIDPTNGDIFLVSEVDYELMGDDNVITLTAIATDVGNKPGPRSSSVNIIITVINENDGIPVFNPGVYTAIISENVGKEYMVVTVTATDTDDVDLNYNIVSGNEDAVFRIDKVGSNGAIVISDDSGLDYEVTKRYSLVVYATDEGGLTGSTTVAIEVEGYNEFIPQLGSLSSTVFIPENSEIDTYVLDLEAVDDDDGVDGEVYYSFTSNGDGMFAINPQSGLVTVAGSIDREDRDSYTVEIAVTDRGVSPGPFSVIYTLSVSVVDVNDIQPVCTSTFYSVSIREDIAPGSGIAQLTCSDADAENPNNEITTYVITYGNEGAEFSVSGTGQVSTVLTLDYETKHYYELVFEVSDSGTTPLTTTTTLGITITDDNDNAPIFTENPYRFEAPEDTPIGSSVGMISATDEDANNAGELIYSLVSGNDAGLFALDRKTGILYVAKILDYDTNPQTYTIVVRASDRSPLPKFDTSTIQFSIRDVNDNYPICSHSLYSGIVQEDAPFQTSIITVICSDVDTTDTLTYTIVSGNIESVFLIDETAGEISIAKANVLDTEAKDNYDLIVHVSDGYFAINVTSVISIIDVNDIAPIFIPSGPFQVDLREDAPIAHTVMKLNASDGDMTPTIFAFAIAGGNEDNKFKMGSLNGVIQLQREIDRDILMTYLYSLEVTVSDGKFTATTTVNVNIIDVNDNAPVCDQMTYTADVPETILVGSTVFEPICNDPDSTTDLNFAIISGNDQDRFLVDEDDGKLKIKNGLDYETTSSYTFTVIVSDQGIPALTTTLVMTVFVEAVNEHKPELFGSFNVSVLENAPINHVIVTLYANDSDIGLDHAVITYAIKSGNNDGLFNIHPSTGLVTVRGRLDYEIDTTHVLTITAADMSPESPSRKSAEEILTIHIMDVNDNYPVFDPQVYVVEINEDTLIGTTIAELTATDADTGLGGTSGLQFKIINGNIGSVFLLSDNAVILAADIDAYTAENYILMVSATDQGVPALSSNTIISIYIKAVNEHSPIFSLSNDTVSIDESINVGDHVYQLLATDDDTGFYSKLRFYIRDGNDNDAFTLDSYTGIITVALPLDYETHTSPYILQLEVEDTDKTEPGITRTSSMALTIELNDVNDEIPEFSQNIYTPSINENIAGGTSIVTVQAIDKDTGPNGQVTYQFVAGSGMLLFTIDAETGIIRTAVDSIIDYESRGSYDLIVKAEDSGIPIRSSSCLVQISVIDLNDETPEFEVETFVTSLLENEPIDTFVTKVVANDKDSIRGNNNVFTYRFSEASATFTIDQMTGEIRTTAFLDREIVSSYTLIVYAIDQGPTPNTGSTTITVQVVDVNDNPPEIHGIYDTSVSENAIPNTAVFLINATDIDVGENGLLTYTITDGNIDGDFKMDSGTGNIQVKNSLDRERTDIYYLEITVTDGGLPSENAILSATVTITDINDNPPVFDRAVYHLNVSEDVPTDTPVGRVTATDADTGLNAAIRYTIGSFIHGDSNHFKVDASSGVISTNGHLDRENADKYVFVYRAFDGGSHFLTATTTVSITVGDFDDHFPEFGASFYSAHTLENQPIGTSILTVVTSDNDFGPNAVITLSIDTKTQNGARADEFIDVDSSTSILFVKKQINREVDPTFHFTLIATDGGAVPLTATATVSIIVEDVNDERPVFSTTYYNSEIAYNDRCAFTVTILSATDKDYGVNAEFVYRFTLNPAPHLFRLGEKNGAITLLATADRGTTYICYAEATDSGVPPLTSNGVTIRIDTFIPNDNVFSFNLGIDETTYLDHEETFLQQLTTVFRLTYPTAIVKRWCVHEDSEISDQPLTTVHLYVVKNNLTDIEGSTDVVEKEFLTSAEAFSQVSADSAGNPRDSIKGTAWDIFAIQSIKKYYVEEIEPELPFFQTAAGVIVVIVIVLAVLAILTLCAIFLMRKARKHNWPACLNQVEHGEDDAGDHVARNQYLTKTYEKKPLPPIGYYEKNNLPPVVALPMPSSTKKVPMQIQSQIYERPKDINIYNDLIGFRPGSGVGSRLMKHPEKLRSGSPASIPELPPARKLSSLISRPPSFAPMKDVSLREITPRELDESTMRTIDDETVSLNTTKDYDGRAVDPVTGRVYEYSTRTHKRRWVNDSDSGSHFRLKTEEKF